MKPRPSYTSRQDLAEIARRLHLGRTMENAHGAGAMSPDAHRDHARSGWTVEQLLQMSAAKAMYN